MFSFNIPFNIRGTLAAAVRIRCSGHIVAAVGGIVAVADIVVVADIAAVGAVVGDIAVAVAESVEVEAGCTAASAVVAGAEVGCANLGVGALPP